MDTVILPKELPQTKKEFLTFLDRCNVEMQHLIARMDEREEHIEKVHLDTQATIDRIEARLRHVQTAC